MSRKLVSTAFSIVGLIITFPTVYPLSAAQVDGANWEYINYDSLGTNFNPQGQITRENVHLLELKWTYPLPSLATSGYAINLGEGFYGVRFHEGSTTPPIIVNGSAFLLTNYYQLIALNASTGRTIWTFQYKADLSEARKKLPLAGVAGHLHGFYYIDGNLIFPGVKCDIIAVNAHSGMISWAIEDICADIPGNAGLYGGVFSYPPALYKKGNILIVQSAVMDGLAGRGFIAGYDYVNKQLKWRFYTAPPAQGDPDWALRFRDRIWIQGVKGTEIPIELLKDDWGDLGVFEFNGRSPWGDSYKQRVARAGTGTVWGQMAVDEDSGIVYFGVSQPSPGYNATYRPGPNLFSDSILALNAINGELVWAHQTTTHDLWDWDCAWNVVLAKVGTKKAVFKACKNGILYALDASNGEITWYFNAPSFRRSAFTPFHSASQLNSGPNDNSVIGNWDPRNPGTFRRPWQNWPSEDAVWQSPTANGGIESDIAYDGKMIYVATYNYWGYVKIASTEGLLNIGGQYLQAPEAREGNTTIWAIDASTGRPMWNFFIRNVGYRGGLTISGGVLYAAAPDGNLYAVDANNGKLLLKKFLGNRLNVPLTIGATKDGKIRLFQIVGGTAFANYFHGAVGDPIPGALMVFGLPNEIDPKVAIKEVKEIPKGIVQEGPREVTKAVTVESALSVVYAISAGALILGLSVAIFLRRRKRQRIPSV